MRIVNALRGVTGLGLDTAPIVYFVENNPDHYARCVPFFQAIDNQQVTGFTSITALTEALVHPLRLGDAPLVAAYRSLLLVSQGLTTLPVSLAIGERAADLRARYNLRTPDAFQVATAIEAGCEAFLTNDARLRRVAEIRVLVVSELTP